jgi:putative endonuclease
MSGGWVYIMTNRPNGTLYTGVTSDIARRAFEHREGLVKGFTKRYGLKRLVYMEFYEDIRDAIQRESNIKHWPRAWKVRLIHAANPDWRDLYEDLTREPTRKTWMAGTSPAMTAPAPRAG